MKKTAVTILLIIIGFTSFSQDGKIKNLRYHDQQPIHFGFTVGLNYMDFTIHKSGLFFSDTVNFYSIENQIHPGFHLGPIVNVRMGSFFDLRFLIDLTFGQRSLNYKIVNTSAGDGTSLFETKSMHIASTFIETPLLLKYKAARMNNMRPYIIVGGNPKYDISARKKPKESELPKIQLMEFDLYADMGFGIDWYMEYFKLSTELKFSLGFIDVLERDGTLYSSSIEKMTSKMFMLSFHFEGP